MKEYRKEFIDESGVELVIKKNPFGQGVFIHMKHRSSHECIEILPHQFKALRKAIKKVTEEASS